MTEQWHVKEATAGWSWVFDDNGKLVATAYLGYENLIAVAPRLLAACKAAAEWRAAYPFLNAIFEQQTSAEVEVQLLAAINKAKVP